VADPDRDTVYSNDGVNRTVYTRENNSTGWFVGIIVALALLAIAYLVFSANSQPSTVDVNNSPTVTTPAPADTLPAPADTTTTPMAPADTTTTPMAPADTTTTPAPVETAPADTAPADAGTVTESAPAPAESAVSAPAAQ
jgi:preprotein translocase subunit SecG